MEVAQNHVHADFDVSGVGSSGSVLQQSYYILLQFQDTRYWRADVDVLQKTWNWIICKAVCGNILDFQHTVDLLLHRDCIYCILYFQIPKHSWASQSLQNFITIIYWPQPLKIYNHAYQFKWRRLESGRDAADGSGDSGMRCLWYYIILGSVYMGAMHNKNTYKNSSWIGAHFALPSVSFFHPFVLSAFPLYSNNHLFHLPILDFCMHKWWKDKDQEYGNI
jgi:hypothetical protein